MNNLELMKDTLSRVIPDNDWQANRNSNISLDNIDLQNEALKIIWGKLFKNIRVPWEKGTSGADMIRNKKREVLRDFIENELRDTLHDIAGFSQLEDTEYTFYSWGNRCVITLVLNNKEENESYSKDSPKEEPPHDASTID